MRVFPFHTLTFLVIVFLLMPALGVRSYLWIRSGKPIPPKLRRYRSLIGGFIFMFVLALLVAHTEEVSLFPPFVLQPVAWTVSLAYVALLLLRIRSAWAKIPEQRKQHMRLLLPENRAELVYWVPISLLAGLVEETVYRGVAYQLLLQGTRSSALAILLCVIAFGVAHMTQGPKAALGVGLIGALLHALVILSGSLYVAMVVHALYDLILGIMVMRLFQSSVPHPTAPQAPAEAQG
jgi:membrane protease YdiL (CAAX protease family)